MASYSGSITTVDWDGGDPVLIPDRVAALDMLLKSPETKASSEF